jgi:hypothetical protein
LVSLSGVESSVTSHFGQKIAQQSPNIGQNGALENTLFLKTNS